MNKKKFWKMTGLTILILFVIMMMYAVLGLRNDVDAVSGATASSYGFLKAVENGLIKAAKTAVSCVVC